MKITPKMLKLHGACTKQYAMFAAEWPEGGDVTEAACLRAVEIGLNLNWAALTLFPATLLAEYERQRAPLWAEYERQEATLLAEYECQRAPLWAEYERQRAPLWAEYERQEAPLWAEYERQRAPLWAEYERQEALLFRRLAQSS